MSKRRQATILAILIALTISAMLGYGSISALNDVSPLPTLPPPPPVTPAPECPAHCTFGCVWSYDPPHPLPDPLECYWPDGKSKDGNKPSQLHELTLDVTTSDSGTITVIPAKPAIPRRNRFICE